MLHELVREKPNPYSDGSARGSKKAKQNYFYLEMKCSAANTGVVVVVGQLID